MTTINWKEHILKPDEVIPFKWMDKDYGRAEFQVCPVFKLGKLREFYMYPAQQRDTYTYYKAVFTVSPIDFSITSTDINNEPYIWLNFWCMDHKCHSFRFYVPKNSISFRVNWLSNFGIWFQFPAP